MNEKNIVRKNNDICNRLFPIAFAILLLVALVVGVIEKNNPNEYTYVKKYESLDKYSVVLIDKEIGNSQEVNLYSYGIAEDCNRISVDTPEKLREYYENYCKNPSVEKVYVIVSSTNKKSAKEMEMQNYKK